MRGYVTQIAEQKTPDRQITFVKLVIKRLDRVVAERILVRRIPDLDVEFPIAIGCKALDPGRIRDRILERPDTERTVRLG